ncbi:hypothetical protein XU18_2689 [Perkinsela sp. CCAP 1560/4]|nr:hypothetical protein XU18_2689 [Perkinsela sp. CCAP 1560/4]|eukprot:KNH06485.1 hypothetical protein XU18_2689 [Perkinsela sp. CCAP 1560/4]
MSQSNDRTATLDFPIHNLAIVNSSLLKSLPLSWDHHSQRDPHDVNTASGVNLCACPSLHSLVNSQSFRTGADVSDGAHHTHQHSPTDTESAAHKSTAFLAKVQQVCINNSNFAHLKYSSAYPHSLQATERGSSREGEGSQAKVVSSRSVKSESVEPNNTDEASPAPPPSDQPNHVSHKHEPIPKPPKASLPDITDFLSCSCAIVFNLNRSPDEHVEQPSKRSRRSTAGSNPPSGQDIIDHQYIAYFHRLRRLMLAIRSIYVQYSARATDALAYPYGRLSPEASMAIYRMCTPVGEDVSHVNLRAAETGAAKEILSSFCLLRSSSEPTDSDCSPVLSCMVSLLRVTIFTTLWTSVPSSHHSEKSTQSSQDVDFFTAITSTAIVEFVLNSLCQAIDKLAHLLQQYAVDEKVFDASSDNRQRETAMWDVESQFLTIMQCFDLLQQIIENLHRILKCSFVTIHVTQAAGASRLQDEKSKDHTYVTPTYFLAQWLTGPCALKLVRGILRILAFPAAAPMHGSARTGHFHLHNLPVRVMDFLFDLLEVQISTESYSVATGREKTFAWSTALPQAVVAFVELLREEIPSVQTTGVIYSDPFDAYADFSSGHPGRKLAEDQKVRFEKNVHLSGELGGKYVSVFPTLLQRTLRTVMSFAAISHKEKAMAVKEIATQLLFAAMEGFLMGLDVDEADSLNTDKKQPRLSMRNNTYGQSVCQMLAELAYCTVFPQYPLAIRVLETFIHDVTMVYLSRRCWDAQKGVIHFPDGASHKRDFARAVSIQCMGGLFFLTERWTEIISRSVAAKQETFAQLVKSEGFPHFEDGIVSKRENLLSRIRLFTICHSMGDLLAVPDVPQKLITSIIQDGLNPSSTSGRTWKAKIIQLLFSQGGVDGTSGKFNSLMCWLTLWLGESEVSNAQSNQKVHSKEKAGLTELSPRDVVDALIKAFDDAGRSVENGPFGPLETFFTRDEVGLFHSIHERSGLSEASHGPSQLLQTLHFYSIVYQLHQCAHSEICGMPTEGQKTHSQLTVCSHYRTSVFRTLLGIFSTDSCAPSVKKSILSLFSRLAGALKITDSHPPAAVSDSTMSMLQIAWKLAKLTLADKNVEIRLAALETTRAVYLQMVLFGKCLSESQETTQKPSVAFNAMATAYASVVLQLALHDASPSIRAYAVSMLMQMFTELNTIVDAMHGFSSGQYAELFGVSVVDPGLTPQVKSARVRMVRLQLIRRVIGNLEWADANRSREKDSLSKAFLEYWLEDDLRQNNCDTDETPIRNSDEFSEPHEKISSESARTVCFSPQSLVDMICLSQTADGDPFFYLEDQCLEHIYAHVPPSGLYGQLPLYALVDYVTRREGAEVRKVKNPQFGEKLMDAFKRLVKELLRFLLKVPACGASGQESPLRVTESDFTNGLPSFEELHETLRRNFQGIIPSGDSVFRHISSVAYCVVATLPVLAVDTSVIVLLGKATYLSIEGLMRSQQNPSISMEKDILQQSPAEKAATVINLLNIMRVTARHLYVEHLAAHTAGHRTSICDNVSLFVTVVGLLLKAVVKCINRYGGAHANYVLKACVSILCEAFTLAHRAESYPCRGVVTPCVNELESASRMTSQGLLTSIYILFNFSFVKLRRPQSGSLGNYAFRHLALLTEFSLAFPFESVGRDDLLEVETGETPNMLIPSETSPKNATAALHNVFASIYHVVRDAQNQIQNQVGQASELEKLLCVGFESLSQIIAHYPNHFLQRAEKLFLAALRSEVPRPHRHTTGCASMCQRCGFLAALKGTVPHTNVFLQGTALRYLARVLHTEEARVEQYSTADAIIQKAKKNGGPSRVHIAPRHDQSGIIPMRVTQGFLPDILKLGIFAPSRHSREVCVEIIVKLLQQSISAPEHYIVALVSAYTSPLALKAWRGWMGPHLTAQKSLKSSEFISGQHNFLISKAPEIIVRMYSHTVTESLEKGMDLFTGDSSPTLNPLTHIFEIMKSFKAFRKVFLTAVFRCLTTLNLTTKNRGSHQALAVSCCSEMSHLLAFTEERSEGESTCHLPLCARFCFFVAHCLYVLLTRENTPTIGEAEKSLVSTLCDDFLWVSDFFEIGKKIQSNVTSRKSERTKGRNSTKVAPVCPLSDEFLLDLTTLGITCILKIFLVAHSRKESLHIPAMDDLFGVIGLFPPKEDLSHAMLDILFRRTVQAFIQLIDEYQRESTRHADQTKIAEKIYSFFGVIQAVYNSFHGRHTPLAAHSPRSTRKATRKSKRVSYADSSSTESEYSSSS